MHISNRDISWYNLALKVAEDSTYHDRHGCVIIHSGRVLGVATNRYVSGHAAKQKYVKQGHAEQRVLSRVSNAVDTTLYSARDHNSNPISTPCGACYELLLKSQVKWVVYHDGQTLQKKRVS